MNLFSETLSNKIIDHARALDVSRRSLQALSAEILSASKRGIFALHRDDIDACDHELNIAREKLKVGWTLVKKEPRIAQEGMWRAAQEEFAEASLFQQYVVAGKIDLVREVANDPDIFVGAISDLAGEMVRRAVLLSSDGKGECVAQLYKDTQSIILFLLQMDLSGSLRSKADQAKQHLRKMEDIRYDVAMRNKK